MPNASPTAAIVFAVNIPAQLPIVGQAARSIERSSSSSMSPTACAPTASKTLTISSDFPLCSPGKIEPPYTKTEGRLILADAISIPGNDLSQPAKLTNASSLSACITASTESAIISLLTRLALIPSCPMEIASLTAIVVNSSGKPPESRTPSLHFFASASRGKLHGVTSFQDEATPT